MTEVLQAEHLERAIRWYCFRKNLTEDAGLFAKLPADERQVIVGQAFEIQRGLDTPPEV